MKNLFFLFFLISLPFLISQSDDLSDYDPSLCDWENNSDVCFDLAQAEFDKEKARLDADIADLQRQNDEVTQEIDREMAEVNKQVADLQKEMDGFQKEMDTAFKDMIPKEMMDEMEKDMKELDNMS
jgi:hypothetical protein